MTTEANNEDIDECLICLEEVDNEGFYEMECCREKYCIPCLEKCRNHCTIPTCPKCRSPFDDDNMADPEPIEHAIRIISDTEIMINDEIYVQRDGENIIFMSNINQPNINMIRRTDGLFERSTTCAAKNFLTILLAIILFIYVIEVLSS